MCISEEEGRLWFSDQLGLTGVQGVPIKLSALINDTTGTLIASAYTDTKMKIGCIFGTGCNAAYMEHARDVPKLAYMNLPPDTLMAINCEWGAFDNEHKVLPELPTTSSSTTTRLAPANRPSRR